MGLVRLGAKGIATRSILAASNKKVLGAFFQRQADICFVPKLARSVQGDPTIASRSSARAQNLDEQSPIGNKGIATCNKRLLVAPGIATSNKKLLGTKGIATRSKDATRTLLGRRMLLGTLLVVAMPLFLVASCSQ